MKCIQNSLKIAVPGLVNPEMYMYFYVSMLAHYTCISFQQDQLSLQYKLSGDFINAILSALSIAVSRDGENPVVCQKDLQQGANLQLRGLSG